MTKVQPRKPAGAVTKIRNDGHSFEKIEYAKLNSRQQENYNFQKIAARLADHGFNCIRLSDDWHGADFIACHIDGRTFLKIQQKSRLSLDKRYIGRDVYIAFFHGDDLYVYQHDAMIDALVTAGLLREDTASWQRGGYSWPGLSRQLIALLEDFKI